MNQDKDKAAEHASDCDIRLYPFDVCSCGKEAQLAEEGYIYKPQSDQSPNRGSV
jgi:hypothetical protein